MSISSKSQNNRLYFFVFILFFFSGAAGLVYQVVWTRELVLIFGNTMLAASTVLSAFMAGLAVGSFSAGKYVDRRPHKLIRVYALLAAGSGVYALLFPLLLAAAAPLYTGLYQALKGNMPAVNIFRFVICFVLIVVPTFLMGATLPVLLKRFVKETGLIGRQVGFFYGLNTVGAVAGSLVCGFLLLRVLGMRLTTLAAAAVNLLIAIAAWLVGKEKAGRREPSTAAAANKEEEEKSTAVYSRITVRSVLIGIGISGFCALAYEVSWTRMLNLFFHNTVYSFTTMLAAFLVGIALGSLIYAKFLSRIANRVLLFILVEIGIGILAYATPFIFNLLYEPLFSRPAEILAGLKAVVIMIGPTLLMGIALPLAVQICQQGARREGSSVGTVYAVNTIGSILGAFASGFLLVPALGIHKSVIAVVSLNIIAGVLVLISIARIRLRPVYGFVFACILVILFVIAPADLFRNLYKEKQAAADLVFYKEGRIANVVVYDFKTSGYKDLYLNGSEEASDRLWHVQLFKMLSVLPVAVHPQPDDALMIAFGAGISAGAGIDLVDYFECAELNPDIFEAAGLFTEENRDVIHNPKLNMILNDGRNHLLLTPRKYSLIISAATNPLTFDSWTLYTKDFYELCKRKLKPGGVFCQWMPIPLAGDSVKVILKTFKTVFPHASFWSIYGCSQCLMLGTPERLQFDYRELSNKLPAVLAKAGLTGYGVDSVDKFLSFFLLGEDELDEYLKGFHKINTDDLPGAQFHSGHNRQGIETSLGLLKYQGTIIPYLTGLGEENSRVQATLNHYRTISRMLNIGFLKGSGLEFKKAFAFASEADPFLARDKNIACMLQYDSARKDYFLKRVKRFPDDANAHNTLGFIYWQEGDYKQAISELEQAVKLKLDFANALTNLAQAYLDAAQYDLAVEKLLKVREINPALNVVNMTLNEFRLIHNLRKVKYQPGNPDLYMNLGRTFLDRQAIGKSIQAYKAALELRKDDPQILHSLAFIYESIDLLDKSLEYYEQLVKVAPGDKEADRQLRDQVTGKIKKLRALQSAPGAWQEWVAAKLKIPSASAQGQHPAGCKRALELWSTYDFTGKISWKDLEAAALEFKKVIAKDKEHLHAYADAAVIYEYMGDYREAADMWRKGLDVASDNRLAVNNLRRMELLLQLDNRPASQRRTEIYNELGVLSWRNGLVEDAIVYFKKALGNESNFAMAYANLGLNYIDAGMYPEAVGALEKALALAPKIDYAQQMKERLAWLKDTLGNIKNSK